MTNLLDMLLDMIPEFRCRLDWMERVIKEELTKTTRPWVPDGKTPPPTMQAFVDWAKGKSVRTKAERQSGDYYSNFELFDYLGKRSIEAWLWNTHFNVHGSAEYPHQPDGTIEHWQSPDWEEVPEGERVPSQKGLEENYWRGMKELEEDEEEQRRTLRIEGAES